MFGSISLGLVWGWLLVVVSGRMRISLPSFGKLLVATALIGIEVRLFSGNVALIAFSGSTLLSLFVHIAWMQELKRRFRSQP